MKFILIYFLIYFSIFKIWENIKKLNFLIKNEKLHAFSQNWNSVNAKKHNATFFGSEEVS